MSYFFQLWEYRKEESTRRSLQKEEADKFCARILVRGALHEWIRAYNEKHKRLVLFRMDACYKRNDLPLFAIAPKSSSPAVLHL